MKGDRGSEESASSLRGADMGRSSAAPVHLLAREIVVWITTKGGLKPAPTQSRTRSRARS